MDKKTELLVWLLEHTCTRVDCTRVMTGEDTDRTEVRFNAGVGSGFFVPDWLEHVGVGMPLQGLTFRPSCSGLFDVYDGRANEIVKARENKSVLVEEREAVLGRLAELNEELGL